jgi:ElaB/YqjD/DUF883 family membrane-anchored ribosome-binding protein
MQEFSNVVEKLKKSGDNIAENTAKVDRNTSKSSESGVMSKLDSLLTSFDPYLNDDAKETMHPLTNLMKEISNYLVEWQDEGSSSGNHTKDDAEAAMSSTRELAEIISNVSPSNEHYHVIMDKLENIIEETKAVAETEQRNETGKSSNIQTAIGKAYAGLTGFAFDISG